MAATNTNQWFTFPKANPKASLRLFCFPYAGGGSLIFRPWPNTLPSSVEVCTAQLPGRNSRLREPAFKRMPPLVDALAEAIVPYLDKPFAFFGHSMGAKIGFELARRLRNSHGLEPAHLFVSGCRAPHILNPEPPTYNLPEPEFIEELRTLNGTPKEVLEHPELMDLMLPLLRADFELVQTYEYVPDKPLSIPITVYGGLQDDDITKEHLEAWGQHTTSSSAVHMFMGGHFFLNSAQPLVLRLLSHQLHQIEGNIGRFSRRMEMIN